MYCSQLYFMVLHKEIHFLIEKKMPMSVIGSEDDSFTSL